jgi:hypothetical protein
VRPEEQKFLPVSPSCDLSRWARAKKKHRDKSDTFYLFKTKLS